MRRRQALILLGAAGMGVVSAASNASLLDQNQQGDAAKRVRLPKLTTEDLARKVREKGFDPNSLYAHEFEFTGVVLIKREVPLLQIKGMTGPYSKVHLYGSGGNVDVGAEMEIKGLIVDNGFGAFMVWYITRRSVEK